MFDTGSLTRSRSLGVEEMKLGSQKLGRDGRLAIVSADNSWMADVADVAPTLQAALDEWTHTAPLLMSIAESLSEGDRPLSRFEPAMMASPLPRSYLWADGSAFVNHVDLVRRARGAVLPESFWTDPLMYQGGSDGFLCPTGDIVMADGAWGIDFEAEIAVIVDDVPAGASADEAAAAIRLLMLVNDVSLRNLIPEEIAKGFGFFQSKPASAFSPLAVTPDELGSAWDGRRLHLPLLSYVNGVPFGRPNAGNEMTFDFGQLVSHAAKTRSLGAGSIVGSGTVSNRDAEGGPGKPIAEGGDGYSCISEIRMVETILTGEARTPYLRDGDTVKIEMLDGDGRSIFGAIEQRVIIR
jgi:fumarylacetoacetate (FAA) hydrolase